MTPLERLTHIRQELDKGIEGRRLLVRSQQPSSDPLRSADHIRGVQPSHIIFDRSADKVCQRVLTNGLEKAKSRGHAGGVCHQQRRVAEDGHAVDRFGRRRFEDGDHPLERESRREHREPPEIAGGSCRQQPDAPVKGCCHRLMPTSALASGQ